MFATLHRQVGQKTQSKTPNERQKLKKNKNGEEKCMAIMQAMEL